MTRWLQAATDAKRSVTEATKPTEPIAGNVDHWVLSVMSVWSERRPPDCGAAGMASSTTVATAPIAPPLSLAGAVAHARAARLTLPGCQVTDLFERIGLMDESGGQEVYDVVARDLGHASFDAAIRTIVDGWAGRLRDCAHPAIDDARLNWNWCEIAARHGWCTQSLWGRFSGLVPRLHGERIARIHRDYAVTAAGSTLMRCPRGDDPPIWETIGRDDRKARPDADRSELAQLASGQPRGGIRRRSRGPSERDLNP